jgi:hypothetical protein
MNRNKTSRPKSSCTAYTLKEQAARSSDTLVKNIMGHGNSQDLNFQIIVLLWDFSSISGQEHMAYWHTLSLHLPGKSKKFTETSTSDISQICNDKAKPADRCLIIWTLFTASGYRSRFGNWMSSSSARNGRGTTYTGGHLERAVSLSVPTKLNLYQAYIFTLSEIMREISELSTSKITNFSSFIKLNLPNRL